MQQNFKNENGHLIADVTFAADEIKTAQDKAVRKLCQNVTIQGFRKGKAPLDKAARYLRGQDVANETVNQLLRQLDKNFESVQEFQDYVKEGKLLNGFQPDVKLTKFEDAEAAFTITYFLKPVITKIASYTGLKADVEEEKVTAAKVNAQIEKLAQDNAELVPSENAAEMGNTVNIDFVGYMNGEEFDGGSAKGFDLELGSNHFVPGFEEQCVGHKAGEKFEVNVIMPDNYPAPLTSKPAVFKVTLNDVKVKQVPEINDEFATTLTGEYASKDLAELKTKTKENLEKTAKDTYGKNLVNALLLQIRDNSEFEIAPEYIDRLVADRQSQDEKSLEQNGLTLDEYLKLVNQDKEVYTAQMRNGIESEIKSSLVYDTIAKAEKVEMPTQADIEKAIGQPLPQFFTNYRNYLTKQGMSADQAQQQANGYVNQVASSMITAKVQAKLLELNPVAPKPKKSSKKAKTEEAPATEEPAAEEPAAEEAKAE